jgi:putative SOS response-associated peptidase YedK
MIITNANEFAGKIPEFAGKIPNRMPVLLQPKDFDGWLTGTAGAELFKPTANDYLQTWPVSRRVNSSRAPGGDSTLIDRVAA